MLGRITYEGFAAAWPKMGETNKVVNNLRDFSIPEGFADRKNMKWNASLI
jgi:hypothetical protein